jgi:hypothetical protein
VEAENGLYRLKPPGGIGRQGPPTVRLSRFILSGEISCIYKRNWKNQKNP